VCSVQTYIEQKIENVENMKIVFLIFTHLMLNLNEIFSNLRSKFEIEQKFKQMTDPHKENMRRQISDDTKKKQIYISLLLMAKSFQL
jgi:hypothetical protein